MNTTFKIQSYIKWLSIFTVFCLLYLVIRNGVAHNKTYNFLVWNAFLGLVPFLVALGTYFFRNKLGKVPVLLLSGLWLLFYPNAPYMITDFIHVNPESKIVVYEALLIFSFAMLSLFYGFYSLKLIEKILQVHYKAVTVKIITWLAILLSSFGLYLGRVLRLNSWDVFTDFFGTMKVIFEHLFPITKNPVTYLMIILFTSIQIILLNLIQDID